ncbi:uncharacterized protein N7506_009219 [Penicillium brevicompactum]|uniref:uncharacterized protein n=1 Tax=Penicillium brevicompactum TaxID=5074 RepID=UPI002541B56A|nr:uncharacterized protein N7506_009219 [Penicillium brevicompactum]KAJ5326117.1 hypothetical protein N7506_009219 [Penicillium brevicompactum]
MFNSNAADSKHDITSGDPDFIDENTEKLPQFLTGSTTSVASEATADEDIPLFFRRYTERYPFGNVHMALRVGPLVIENGVSHSKGGALITHRSLPVLQVKMADRDSQSRRLAVSGEPDRFVWQQAHLIQRPKRYKAMLKQVVGAPFSGILSQEKENEIIGLVLDASRKPFDDPGLPASDQRKILDSSIEQICGKIKLFLKTRVDVYLRSIVDHLLNADLPLTWNARTNNCQNFCNSLLDQTLFGPLVNGPSHLHFSVMPLYTMSFVCPQEGYVRHNVKTKYDVPSGLTEEYLLRFHFGRHDDADIIDSLQEYWYDWGAFGSSLYKCQDLFPWDCTEAYGRYPTRCGDCNTAKHIVVRIVGHQDAVLLQTGMYQYVEHAVIAGPAVEEQDVLAVPGEEGVVVVVVVLGEEAEDAAAVVEEAVVEEVVVEEVVVEEEEAGAAVRLKWKDVWIFSGNFSYYSSKL